MNVQYVMWPHKNTKRYSEIQLSPAGARSTHHTCFTYIHMYHMYHMYVQIIVQSNKFKSPSAKDEVSFLNCSIDKVLRSTFCSTCVPEKPSRYHIYLFYVMVYFFLVRLRNRLPVDLSKPTCCFNQSRYSVNDPFDAIVAHSIPFYSNLHWF